MADTWPNQESRASQVLGWLIITDNVVIKTEWSALDYEQFDHKSFAMTCQKDL